MALDEWVDTLDGGWSAWATDGAGSICGLISILIPWNAAVTGHPLDPDRRIAFSECGAEMVNGIVKSH